MIHVLFGTETGNAELVAEDIAERLNQANLQTDVTDMAYFDVADLDAANTYVLVCSTYGDGELPNSAQSFYAQLQEKTPDLSGLKFAVFGLGDSYYTTFNQGCSILKQQFNFLGATQLGQVGVHDASAGEIPTDVALSWADEELLPALAAWAQ